MTLYMTTGPICLLTEVKC